MDSTRRSSLYFENNKRISHPLFPKTTTGISKSGEQSVQHPNIRQNDSCISSNAEPRCCRSSQSRTKLCLEYVSGTKKRRVSPTHLQSIQTERICNSRQISSHKCLPCSRLSAVQGLDVQNRFVTGVLPPTNMCVSQTIPASSLQRRIVANDMSPLRFEYGAQSVCFPDKLGSSNSKRTRDTYYRLFGRLSPGPSKSSCPTFSGTNSARKTFLPRLANKSREINNNTPKKTHLSGSSMGYLEERENFTKRKVSQSLFQDHAYFERRFCSTKRITEPSRPSQFFKLCSTQRETSLPRSSRSSQHRFPNDKYQTFSTSESSIKRPSVVAPEQSLTLYDSFANPITFSRDRCIGPSLGCAVRQPSIFRTVDRSGTKTTLQPERAARCFESLTSAASIPESIHGSMAKRQQNSGRLHSTRGRNEIPSAHEYNIPDFSFVRALSNSDDCSSYTGQVQRPRRSSISLPVTSRVAPSTSLHRNDLQKIRNPCYRSFCLKECPCSSQLCVFRSKRQSSDFTRCFLPSMELPPSVDFSSTLPDSQSASSPQSSNRHISSDSPVVESCILEVRPQVQSFGSSIHTTSPRSVPNRHFDRSSTLQRPRNDTRSMDMWGWTENLTTWDVSQLNLLLSSWRPSTRKTYKVAWDRWLSWSKLQKLNPFSPSGSNLAKFLADLHIKEKLSYSTILLHKSVVSTLCNTELSGHLSSHVLVRHVLKSISLKKPVAHTKSVWNIDVLVSFLERYNIDENSLFQTSRHSAALLLLCSGRRVHDLTLLAIDEDHYEEHDDHVILWPKFGSKTDNSDFRQSGWKLLKNPKCKNLDPVFWVNHCKELLSDRREVANITNLFVHLRGQAKVASRTVIAGWVKSLLTEAGIIASPGSIRSAVASKNWTDNLPMDEILSRGNWRSGNTFRQFYRREVMKAPTYSSITSSFVPFD